MTNAVEDIFKMQLNDAKITTIIVTAKNMYSQMDQDSDGCLTEEEFVTTCLKAKICLTGDTIRRIDIVSRCFEKFPKVFEQKIAENRL